jgi:hypothetical protein
MLVVILGGTILAMFLYGGLVDGTGAKELGNTAITPVAALVGSALGYYYGIRKQ